MNLKSLTNVLMPHTMLPTIPGIPLGGSPSAAAVKHVTKGQEGAGKLESLVRGAQDGVEAQQGKARDIFAGPQGRGLTGCDEGAPMTGLHDLNKGMALAELINEGGFRKLPKDIQARMLQEAVNGNEALVERFARLAGDKRFASLPAETQEKAVELLAGSQRDKAGSALIEKLLKLESFGRLSQADQAEILEVIATKEGKTALQEVLSGQAYD